MHCKALAVALVAICVALAGPIIKVADAVPQPPGRPGASPSPAPGTGPGSTPTTAAPGAVQTGDLVFQPGDPNAVYIEAVNYGGSGCPQNSASVAFNPTRTTFTILYDSFITSAGPNVALTQARKNCQLNTRVHLPSGFQYSIVTVDYRGFARLDKGVSSSISSTYYFGGALEQVAVRSPFVGPVTQDYTFRDTMNIASLVWSPCGISENLNANTQIFVDNSQNATGAGLMTVDSTDLKVVQILGLQWRKCNVTAPRPTS